MSNNGYHFVYSADVEVIEAEGKCLSLSVRSILLYFFRTILRFMLYTTDPQMGFLLAKVLYVPERNIVLISERQQCRLNS